MARAKHGSGELSDSGKLTFGEWADRCLELRRPACEPQTYSRPAWTVRKHLKPHLGKVSLGKLAAVHVEGLYAALTTAGVGQNERRRAGGCLSMILRHAVKRRLIPYNPAADVPRPKQLRREFTAWTAEQATAFLAALFWLSLDAGPRPGEVLGLSWPDVNLDAGTVTIVRSPEELAGQFRLKDVKTPKGRRTVALSEPTVARLRRHREGMRDEGRDVEDGPVFPSRAGTFIGKSNLLRYVFQPAMQRAKVPTIRPYDLRHTSATLLLQAGVNIKVVSERLGHASIEITLNHYVHVLPG